jgi:hypothetical protein
MYARLSFTFCCLPRGFELGRTAFAIHCDRARQQCCQMVYFCTKNPNLGIHILESFGMENVGIFYCYLVDFTVIRYILFPFVHFVVNWYSFDSFGMLY